MKGKTRGTREPPLNKKSSDNSVPVVVPGCNKKKYYFKTNKNLQKMVLFFRFNVGLNRGAFGCPGFTPPASEIVLSLSFFSVYISHY
jgi:hypothetical protein